MRSYDAATLAALQTRAGVIARVLMRVSARNRTTGLPEEMALWTGGYDRSFTVDGVARTYVGAGAITQVSPITMQAGLAVRMQRVTLAPLSPVIANLIRTYDARFAPVEIHRALFATTDNSLVAPPHRLWKGFIDDLEVTTPEVGSEATCVATLASTARLLTRTLPLKKSDATQRLRQNDAFRQYVDISGSVGVWWGESRGGGQSAAAPPPPSRPGTNNNPFRR